jgi:hypothetical protein
MSTKDSSDTIGNRTRDILTVYKIINKRDLSFCNCLWMWRTAPVAFCVVSIFQMAGVVARGLYFMKWRKSGRPTENEQTCTNEMRNKGLLNRCCANTLCWDGDNSQNADARCWPIRYRLSSLLDSHFHKLDESTFTFLFNRIKSQAKGIILLQYFSVRICLLDHGLILYRVTSAIYGFDQNVWLL